MLRRATATAAALGIAVGASFLPAAAQPPLREKFRQFLDARLAAFRCIPDVAAFKAELDRSGVAQNDIWAQATAACRDSGSQPATMLLQPALNEMLPCEMSFELVAESAKFR